MSRRLSARMDPAGELEQRTRRGRELLAYQRRLALEQRAAEERRLEARRAAA